MDKPVQLRSILCVHQGSELYGSDRSFLQSVKSLRRSHPDAHINVVLPVQGPLVELLQEFADEVVVREMAVLRRGGFLRSFMPYLGRLPGFVRRAHADCRGKDLVYINTVVLLDFILVSYQPGSRAFIHIRETPGILLRMLFSLLLAPSRAKLIFNSNFTRNAYFLLGWKPGCVIHNAAQDYDFIEPMSPSDAGLRILHLGRFNGMKGQELLLEAVAALSTEEQQKLRIRIVGSEFGNQNGNEARIRKHSAALGLDGLVEVLPFTPFPEKLFAWADVVVVPSTRPESFGRIAIEAMSAGRCVVAANHGGLSEIVTPCVDGLLFRANDVRDLRSRLRQLLHDREMLLQLGKQGRVSYKRRFTEDGYEVKFTQCITHKAGGGF
ncbi:glycosyltransferase family 4 protein [Thiolapillus brandeum]|nr:glycosyltransferase family 4 protein [Thiolapillus brandeum]